MVACPAACTAAGPGDSEGDSSSLTIRLTPSIRVASNYVAGKYLVDSLMLAGRNIAGACTSLTKSGSRSCIYAADAVVVNVMRAPQVFLLCRESLATRQCGKKHGGSPSVHFSRCRWKSSRSDTRPARSIITRITCRGRDISMLQHVQRADTGRPPPWVLWAEK